MNKKLDYKLIPHPEYGFLQVSPTPSDEEITQFYANEFYSGDYKNLGKLIIKISKMSKVERENLGNNGLNFCKKEFDKKYLILKLESIMKNLINK